MVIDMDSLVWGLFFLPLARNVAPEQQRFSKDVVLAVVVYILFFPAILIDDDEIRKATYQKIVRNPTATFGQKGTAIHHHLYRTILLDHPETPLFRGGFGRATWYEEEKHLHCVYPPFKKITYAKTILMN